MINGVKKISQSKYNTKGVRCKVSSEKICDWERSRIDEDDFPGIMDDYFRWVDKLKARNKELEEQHEMDIELFIGYQNKIRELTADITVLKDLIPHKVDERS